MCLSILVCMVLNQLNLESSSLAKMLQHQSALAAQCTHQLIQFLFALVGQWRVWKMDTWNMKLLDISLLGTVPHVWTFFQKLLPSLHPTGISPLPAMENLIHLKRKCCCSKNLSLFARMPTLLHLESYFKLGCSLQSATTMSIWKPLLPNQSCFKHPLFFKTFLTTFWLILGMQTRYTPLYAGLPLHVLLLADSERILVKIACLRAKMQYDMTKLLSGHEPVSNLVTNAIPLKLDRI